MKGLSIIKRIGNLYEKIYDLDNCILAVRNATRYKYKINRPGSFVFTVASNPHYFGYKVHKLLSSRLFVPSAPNKFTIKEGIRKKLREISAPRLFYDQVVHWAIMQVVHPYLLKSFYHYTCGSIPNRGPGMIKTYLTKILSIDEKNHVPVRTWYKYCLKLDIHHFFQSINKEILIAKLNRFFKDKELIKILTDIIYSTEDPGLPIGYYTSQWLSNFYLSDFDHWLKKRLCEIFPHNVYIRYVDDIVIIGSNKRKLRKLLEEIKIKLKTDLGLDLKYDTPDQIFDIGKRPIDFVGFRFTYGNTTVRNAIFHRAIDKEVSTNKKKYTVKNLSGILSYNGWIGTRNTIKTKDKLYSHTDGHYKFHLQKCKNEYKYRKRMSTIEKSMSLRNKIIDMGLNDYESGVVTLRRCVFDKETNRYNLIIEDSISI